MSELIAPKQQGPTSGGQVPLKPVPVNLLGQANQIIRSNAASIIKPKLLIVDYDRMLEETAVNNIGSGTYSADKAGVFGLPVFDVVKLQGLTYTDFEDKEITLPDFTLDIALIEVSQTRNIIRTPITGANGTRKEYISDGDYEIKIVGNLINKLANIPPADLIKSLNAFCKAQVEIAVESGILSYLDISSIVIAESRFKQVQGFRNVIDYELMCYSETPFEIKSNSNA